jgi:Major Facilitator Superfamily
MNAEDADHASRHAALTLTLALPGDTVLYLLLPLHAATFGVTLPEAGLLLAANRIVRVFGYHWVARFYATRGPRAACLAASAGAILSTFGYAACSGIWPLLVARLMWGLAFAAMNISNQALPTSHMQDAPRRMGRARSIVAVGPMAGLLAGGITADLWGPRVVFFALGRIAFAAPVFAIRLPTTPEPVVQTTAAAGGTRYLQHLVVLHGICAGWAVCVRPLPSCRGRRRQQRCHCCQRCHGSAPYLGDSALSIRRPACAPLRRAPDAGTIAWHRRDFGTLRSAGGHLVGRRPRNGHLACALAAPPSAGHRRGLSWRHTSTGARNRSIGGLWLPDATPSGRPKISINLLSFNCSSM